MSFRTPSTFSFVDELSCRSQVLTECAGTSASQRMVCPAWPFVQDAEKLHVLRRVLEVLPELSQPAVP